MMVWYKAYDTSHVVQSMGSLFGQTNLFKIEGVELCDRLTFHLAPAL